ncbi:MAG: Gfo/Idh/MocA family oxidoreductase [Planctomycetota bacterium]
MTKIRVLVVGCGNMGASHARAYRDLDADFEIAGLVSRGAASRTRLAAEVGNPPTFSSFAGALETTQPDAVSINTYPDTHASMVRDSLRAGAHVFVEKPLAETAAEAEELVALAAEVQRQLVIGYILRVHPAWSRFVTAARELGKPLVMRMNLNQQSQGKEWETHKALMQSMSPIVDCGVHYVDVMCQMTRAHPVRVQAIGARLSDEIAADMYNYGQLQVVFADGSIGWYEAGWGPMMSEAASFVKDVVGPLGSVSIVAAGEDQGGSGASADVQAHTKTTRLRIHRPGQPDEMLDTSDEPDHDGLCRLEQELFLAAIRGGVDLHDHLEDAVRSLRIVLAADESVRTGRAVELAL